MTLPFFHAMQFGAPHIFGVIEPSIDMRPQIAQPGVVNKDSHEYGDRRNTNGKGDLNGLIGHRCLQNTL
jgi:hypothetical protein